MTNHNSPQPTEQPERDIKANIYAVFCGAGKTYVCEKTSINAVEVEYWKYKDNGLQKEYVEEINRHLGVVDYIFISTEPDGIRLLHKEGFDITIVYPENDLRCEYLDRYISRDSSVDFIGAFMKYWNIWINELKEQTYCKHIVLKSGEYLQDVMQMNISNEWLEPLPSPSNCGSVDGWLIDKSKDKPIGEGYSYEEVVELINEYYNAKQ